MKHENSYWSANRIPNDGPVAANDNDPPTGERPALHRTRLRTRHNLTPCLTLFQGACLEVMKGFADGSVDLILADLPFQTTGASWDRHLDHAAVIAEFERVLSPLGTVVAFGSDQFTFKLHAAFEAHATALRYRYSAIWKKTRATGFLHADNRPMKSHEDILIFSKGLMGHLGCGAGKTLNRMTFNPQGLVSLPSPIERRPAKSRPADGSLQGRLVRDEWGVRLQLNGKSAQIKRKTHTNFPRTVLEHASEVAKKGERHPTKKPVSLIRELVLTYSNPGDTVLDPTMGSGTTGVACQNIGDRHFVGIERDAGYFAIAQARMGMNLKAAG